MDSVKRIPEPVIPADYLNNLQNGTWIKLNDKPRFARNGIILSM